MKRFLEKLTKENLSLVISIFALLAVSIQTVLQWRARNMDVKNMVEAQQLAACTSLTTKFLSYTLALQSYYQGIYATRAKTSRLNDQAKKSFERGGQLVLPTTDLDSIALQVDSLSQQLKSEGPSYLGVFDDTTSRNLSKLADQTNNISTWIVTDFRGWPEYEKRMFEFTESCYLIGQRLQKEAFIR